MLDETQTARPVGPAAGWWPRFGAWLVDAIILAIVNTILRVLLGTHVGTGIGIVIDAAYFTYFHGRTGQTPGDAALGIRVVDVRDRPGEPIGYGRAFIRWLVSIVSGVVILLGYFWMLWDGQKQTWHDKAVGSVPIRLER
jgi:uncharacterized RDD family membrane protein YckC